MTSAATLLADLARAGITVRAEKGRLFVSPTERLTADLRNDLAKHRDAVLSLLNDRNALTDAQLQALAERAHADPPDWSGSRTALRESALVNLDGRWVALDPAMIEESRAWNQVVADRHARKHHQPAQQPRPPKPAGPAQQALFAPEGGPT